MLASPFQRLGVSPDGSRVAFELTDEFSILPTLFQLDLDQVPLEEEGIYVVRADGSGLRRLGLASREPTFHAGVEPDLTDSAFQSTSFNFSPSGDRITYADHGPDHAGETAIQIMTLNLETGERKQITHLQPPPQSDDPLFFFVDSGPVFIDEETIGFATKVEGGPVVAYTVKADGNTEPVPLPPPLTRPGSVIAPGFLITGSARNVYPLLLPGTSGTELFASDGKNLLQLTNFGHGDTGVDVVLSRDRQRALFNASADPFGANRNNNCQFFSVDTLGGDLRQLTGFDEGQPAMGGCNLADRVRLDASWPSLGTIWRRIP